MKHDVDGDTNCSWCNWNGLQSFRKEIRTSGHQRKNGNYQDYSIVEIVHNIEKSPSELRGLAVTQTPVKDHQSTLVWKTHKK